MKSISISIAVATITLIALIPLVAIVARGLDVVRGFLG